MNRLNLLIYTIASPTLAGAGVVAALVQPDYSAKMMIIGAAVGALIAIPVAWYVAKQISKM